MNTSWIEKIKKPNFPKLKNNTAVDVLIVGGGMAGISTAYMLTLSGKRVALVEANRIGAGATHMTTAFLTHVIDTSLSDISKMFGDEKAKLVWESHSAAIDLIEEISKDEKIDCEFKRVPAYVYASTEDQFKDLESEIEEAHRLGFTHLSLKKKSKALPFNNYGFIEIKHQAKFHPLKFLYGLAERTVSRGGQIFERTKIAKIRKGKLFTAITEEGVLIKAPQIIVATYQPFNSPKNVFAKKGMYKSYVMELAIPKGTIKEGLYWDNSAPYNYFRIDEGKSASRMILGGADHRAELKMSEAKNFKALKDHLRNTFGDVDWKITKKWTGPILEPSDGLALIGEYKLNEFIATGFSGNGMTYSIISSVLLKDLVLGRQNPWMFVYDPTRSRAISRYFRRGMDYARELFGGAIKNTVKYRAK